LLKRIKKIVSPKEVSEEVVVLNIAEALGNGRAITIPTNESCILSAHENAGVNVKLTPREGSSLRGQLATKESGIVRVFLEAKFLTIFTIQWVIEWVG
jgi:hypothetical protein